MNALSEQKRAQLRDDVIGLAMSCPVDLCNPKDCPLYHIRHLNQEDRLEWFQNLTDDELVYLSAYHFVCMKTRLEAGSAKLSN